MLEFGHTEHNSRPDRRGLKLCLPLLLIAATLSMQGALAAEREEMMITAQKRGEQAAMTTPVSSCSRMASSIIVWPGCEQK